MIISKNIGLDSVQNEIICVKYHKEKTFKKNQVMPLKGSIYILLELFKSRDKYGRRDMGRKKNEKAKLKGSCLYVKMYLFACADFLTVSS